jgi:hypothetical protein
VVARNLFWIEQILFVVNESNNKIKCVNCVLEIAQQNGGGFFLAKLASVVCKKLFTNIKASLNDFKTDNVAFFEIPLHFAPIHGQDVSDLSLLMKEFKEPICNF